MTTTPRPTRTATTRAKSTLKPSTRPKRGGTSKQTPPIRSGAQKRRSVDSTVVRIAKTIKATMREAEFQRHVLQTLTSLGYIVWVFPIMKRTIAGVPDLTFWHPNRPGHLHFWELKTEKGRVRPQQIVAIKHLSTVPGVDARIVRPSEWEKLRDRFLEPLDGGDDEGKGL